MKRVKKAVGYVCPIPIPGTNEIIGKHVQIEKIKKHAAAEGIELLAIFEDDEYGELAARPGVKSMADSSLRFELVLVERVWALARKKRDLEPLLENLDGRDVTLVAASYMWDMVSQQVRHRYAARLVDRARKEMAAKVEAQALKVVA